MSLDNNKLLVLETVMNQIERQYGKGSVVRLGLHMEIQGLDKEEKMQKYI
ncbi:MAG: hypothetical protein GX275_10930 [Clostridiales bacterium]|nr:hypothetical protein [Clostridiales bacterium]